MSEMYFSEEHEWVGVEDDGTALVGITEYAQEQLGEIVYVELPEVGREFQQGDELSVIESVKAAGDLFAPLTGAVVAVNETLGDAPETVNSDPLGEGWIMRISIADTGELAALMDRTAYDEFVAELE